jgi:hypothetical protein
MNLFMPCTPFFSFRTPVTHWSQPCPNPALTRRLTRPSFPLTNHILYFGIPCAHLKLMDGDPSIDTKELKLLYRKLLIRYGL